MKESIASSKAKIIYICNIMTKYGETNNFRVEDFVDVIEKYIGKNKIDYVLVNNAPIREELVIKYMQEEGKKPVRITDLSLFTGANYKIIERDVVNEADYIRHDPEKLAKVIADFIEGWIK